MVVSGVPTRALAGRLAACDEDCSSRRRGPAAIGGREGESTAGAEAGRSKDLLADDTVYISVADTMTVVSSRRDPDAVIDPLVPSRSAVAADNDPARG
jgi:hypothetical protein